jgi:hypothetical protein
MSVNPVPPIEETATAVVKAVNARRERHAADPAHAALTTADIAERVTAITLAPRAGRDGWWLVGRVLDELVDAESSVWYMPGSRRNGFSQCHVSGEAWFSAN